LRSNWDSSIQYRYLDDIGIEYKVKRLMTSIRGRGWTMESVRKQWEEADYGKSSHAAVAVDLPIR